MIFNSRWLLKKQLQQFNSECGHWTVQLRACQGVQPSMPQIRLCLYREEFETAQTTFAVVNCVGYPASVTWITPGCNIPDDGDRVCMTLIGSCLEPKFKSKLLENTLKGNLIHKFFPKLKWINGHASPAAFPHVDCSYFVALLCSRCCHLSCQEKTRVFFWASFVDISYLLMFRDLRCSLWSFCKIGYVWTRLPAFGVLNTPSSLLNPCLLIKTEIY